MSTKVTVAGRINDPQFHKAVTIARCLEQEHPHAIRADCHQFFETQWSQFLKKTSNQLKGVFYNHDESKALIFLNGHEYIGDADEFAQWALYRFNYQDKDGLPVYTKLAHDTYTEAINQSDSRSYATMTITHSGVSGNVILELFKDIAPKTCNNFMNLCNGTVLRNSDKVPITY
jgi:cyclophilin family peptidyl-prolyl cis-trans isomerase